MHYPWVLSKKKADQGIYELTKTEEVVIGFTYPSGADYLDVQDVTTTVHLDLECTELGWRVKSADCKVWLPYPIDFEPMVIVCPEADYSLDPLSATWKFAAGLKTPFE